MFSQSFIKALCVSYTYRYRRPTKRHLKRAMQGVENNASLHSLYRQPAFAHPHTRVIESITLETIEVEKPKLKTIGAYYSASNEAVEFGEVDASVYQDPLLNLALAQGRSTNSEQVVQEEDTCIDRTYLKSSSKNDNLAMGKTTQIEDYAYVGPGDLEMISSGLPEERTAITQADVPEDNVANSHENEEYFEPGDNQPCLEGISSETNRNINPAFARDEDDEMNDVRLSSETNKGTYESLHPDSSEKTIHMDLGKDAGISASDISVYGQDSETENKGPEDDTLYSLANDPGKENLVENVNGNEHSDPKSKDKIDVSPEKEPQ